MFIVIYRMAWQSTSECIRNRQFVSGAKHESREQAESEVKAVAEYDFAHGMGGRNYEVMEAA